MSSQARRARNETAIQLITRNQLASERFLGELGRDLSPIDIDFAREQQCNRTQWWFLQNQLETLLAILEFYTTGPGRLPLEAFGPAKKARGRFNKEIAGQAINVRSMITAQLHCMELDIASARPLCAAAKAKQRRHEAEMRARVATTQPPQVSPDAPSMQHRERHLRERYRSRADQDEEQQFTPRA